jgi:hypothetical protein
MGTHPNAEFLAEFLPMRYHDDSESVDGKQLTSGSATVNDLRLFLLRKDMVVCTGCRIKPKR